MINKFIEINYKQKQLNDKFLNSLFLKRINKILDNLNFMNLKLEKFNINIRTITLNYKFYIGGNEYDTLIIKLPSNFYFKKHNNILNYLLSNINNNELYNLDLKEDNETILKNAFISFNKDNKNRIKELNRELNKLYMYDNNLNIYIPVYNKHKYNKIKDELKSLQQLKEF